MPRNLTVMMAARNSSRTIGSAIKSVLRGINSDDQLLIYNDASTDTTESVVRGFKHEKRIKLICGENRVGVNVARNIILNLAETEFVAVLDADDISLPWRFKVSFKSLGNLDGIFGTALVFGAQMRPLPLLPQYPITLNHRITRIALSIANPLVHSTGLFRRKSILDLGGYSDSVSEDYELWLRLVNNGRKIGRLGTPLAAYRFHEKQLSQNPEFQNQALKHPALREQLLILRQDLSEEILGGYTEADFVDEMKSVLYVLKPSLRLEHYGLPPFLRRWKNAPKIP